MAGGWWQLAGGWVVSQPAGGQRVRRAACRLVARPDWSAGGWAGGSEGGPVGQPRWALVAGAWQEAWQAFGGWRALGGDGSAGDSAAIWRAVGRLAVGGRRSCEAAAQSVRSATAVGGSGHGRGPRGGTPASPLACSASSASSLASAMTCCHVFVGSLGRVCGIAARLEIEGRGSAREGGEILHFIASISQRPINAVEGG